MRFKNKFNLNWCTGSVKLLGLSICNTDKDNYTMNFEPIIMKMRTIFRIWKQRRLSLKGKVTVINSLAASLLIYPCTCLNTPDNVTQEINQLFFNFLWDGGTNKIAKNTIIRQISDGGLNMIDIASKIKATKLTWIKRLIINPQSPWNCIITELLNGIPFDYLIKSSSDCTPYMQNLPTFYKTIYKIWREIYVPEPKTYKDICSQNLWLNSNITVQNKPILWRKWFDNGIRTINDILDTNGNFMDQDTLSQKYNITCNFIEYLRIRQAIPSWWRRVIISDPKYEEHNIAMPVYIKLRQKNSPVDFCNCKSQDIYWSFINIMTEKKRPNCINRWESIYNIDADKWSHIFQVPFKSCRETYLQSFQYRIIHRILLCNNWLFNLKISDSNLCTYRYCNSKDIDSIQHHLITCTPVVTFWNNFVNWWNRLNFSKLLPLVEENRILGVSTSSNEDVVLNFCLILATRYIYTSKRNQT
jgi:hypothetical protein